MSKFTEKDTICTPYVKEYPDCTNHALPEITLLEKLQNERQTLIKKHNQRMRELNRTISLLENSNAESIIEEAKNILYKEN